MHTVVGVSVRYLLNTTLLQLLAQLVSYNWQVETLQMKAEWRSVSTICGVLCAMTFGKASMLWLCVDNWGTPLKVSN